MSMCSTPLNHRPPHSMATRRSRPIVSPPSALSPPWRVSTRTVCLLSMTGVEASSWRKGKKDTGSLIHSSGLMGPLWCEAAAGTKIRPLNVRPSAQATSATRATVGTRSSFMPAALSALLAAARNAARRPADLPRDAAQQARLARRGPRAGEERAQLGENRTGVVGVEIPDALQSLLQLAKSRLELARRRSRRRRGLGPAVVGHPDLVGEDQHRLGQ